jgi:hypothetical protein
VSNNHYDHRDCHKTKKERRPNHHNRNHQFSRHPSSDQAISPHGTTGVRPKSLTWDIPFRDDPIQHHVPPENDNPEKYPPEYPGPDTPGDPAYEDERNVPPTDPDGAAATPADPLPVAPQTAFPNVKEKSSEPAEPFIADGIAIPGPSHVDEPIPPPNPNVNLSKKGFFKSAKSLWTSMTSKTPKSVVKQKRKTGKTTDETVVKKETEKLKEVLKKPSEKKGRKLVQKEIRKREKSSSKN